MRVFGEHRRSVEVVEGGISILDQTKLPFNVERVVLRDVAEVARAIRTMQVRGAPLIGVTGAWGLVLALERDPRSLDEAHATLLATRPTAVNLRWALDAVRARVKDAPLSERAAIARAEATRITEDDVATCAAIGDAGLPLLQTRADRVRVLTHCNAGWLACVDWGTALAPIYKAHDAGIPLHVWVSETRPRNQGAQLTAWELGAHGVPHTIIADNACGHLIARGMVDLCMVGADRVTARGDVANKIGTYLKALAAKEARVPFWVALPYSTIDWTLEDGEGIPIEERAEEEVTTLMGVRTAPEQSRAYNPAFDVTPARFVTGFVTERGQTEPAGLRALYGRAT